MKKFYSLIFPLFILLLLSAKVQANRVYVKGTIKYSSNGAPVANQQVNISVAASTGSNACTISHQVLTNPNGLYYDSLECTGADITQVRISTNNCDNLPHVVTVPASKVIESNFTVCGNPPTTNCQAAFTSLAAAVGEIKFSSSNSHGTSSADNIVKRRWTFGDGKILEGNEVSPAHAYEHGGTYEVCLTITTSTGCENKTCQNIVLAETHCKAKFSATSQTTANVGSATIKFNSSASTTSSSTDAITERHWKFGDGSELAGNVVDPTHTYTKAGSYNACLTIRTTSGCTSDSCTMIQVLAPAASCKADITATTSGKTVKFNSINSQTLSGDIISRRWEFGDGKILEGNIKDPSHEYAATGTYTACLTIKSNAGCESKECKQVVITEKAVACSPQFTFEKLSLKKFRFNSSGSTAATHDTIVERKWDFGDGSAVLTGNEVSPAKEFPRAGIYTVCLKIKTRSGCENQYCTTVHIDENTPAVTSDDQIKIVSLHPNPATSPVTTEVWSSHNNITAELSIFDIYGVKKWSVSKVLLQGTNVNVIPTSSLAPGPYFFRVTTMYGVQSKQFYKL